MNNNGMDEEFDDLDESVDDDLYTELDDDRRAELNEMLGLTVLGIELWDESLGDEEDAEPVQPEDRVFFDCDLYLEDNLALELYVAAVYPDPEKDPISGMDTIFDVVGRLADDKLALIDYGEADEEGGIALAFGKGDDVSLVVVASAWMISEWEPTKRKLEARDWKLETRCWRSRMLMSCDGLPRPPASIRCRSKPLAVLRLAVLDVDGTLKRAESPYQYLHERLGVAASGRRKP